MIDKIQYYLVIFLIKFLMLFPKSIRRKFFEFLGYLTYLVYTKNKKIIEANLNYIYDNNISKEKIKQIQKECYRKLFLNILSIMEGNSYTKEELKKIVTFTNMEFIKNLQKPYIIVTAHFGNIDFLGLVLAKFFGKMTQVQQKIKNPYLFKYIEKQRESYGLNMVEKHGAVKKLFFALKKGEPISLIIDQNTNPKYSSKVKFLGKIAYQTLTSSQLSKKFNIPILPVFIKEEKKGYTVIFKEPIYPKDKSIEELNQIQADVMSEVINKYPHEWFWCHKRFKNSAPQIYK